jgi:hypothetical protein
MTNTIGFFNEKLEHGADMSDGERFFFTYCREQGIQSIDLRRKIL